MSIDFVTPRDVLFAFTMPIAQVRVTEVEEINGPLRAEILRRTESEAGLVRSNVGG